MLAAVSQCRYLNIHFECQWPGSGRTSSIPSNYDKCVSLNPFPIELAFDHEIEPRIRDVVGNLENISDIARRDRIVVSAKLTQVLK